MSDSRQAVSNSFPEAFVTFWEPTRVIPAADGEVSTSLPPYVEKYASRRAPRSIRRFTALPDITRIRITDRRDEAPRTVRSLTSTWMPGGREDARPA